jgi:hypothetical protein
MINLQKGSMKLPDLSAHENYRQQKEYKLEHAEPDGPGNSCTFH